MAEPNIVGVTSILGKTAAVAVGTSATDLIAAVATGHVAKVNTLMVSNIDGTNSCWLTVDHYRSSTARRIVYQLPIPAATTLDILSKPIYLHEGDALRVTAQASGDLEALASYEDIS